MKKTLKIFATLVILITFPLVVYAQTTTEDTKTTTSVDNLIDWIDNFRIMNLVFIN